MFISALVAGLTTAITTALGVSATGFFASLIAFTLKTVIGLAVNLLMAEMNKPEKPQYSIQGTLQSGGDVPRSFTLGYRATAGSLVYANTWGEEGGTPNAYLVQVIAFSDNRVSLPINKIVVNGVECTLLLDEEHEEYGYPVEEYRGTIEDNLWVKIYDGTQTVADPYLVDRFSDHEDLPYQNTRVGYGVAYFIATAKIDEKLYTGFPGFRIVYNGMPLYDISKDSSVGGDGPQRWDDPDTWGGDGDHLLGVQVYNLLRGIYYEDQWMYGSQNIQEAQLPAEDWIAVINKCRTPPTGDGITYGQFRSSLEIPVNTVVADTIEQLLPAGLGRLSEIGGIYKLKVGEPENYVASFTDNEIIVTKEKQFTPFYALQDTTNGINARYPNPEDNWNAKVAPPIYRTDLEALVGNRRLLADLSLDAVPYPEQVQRVMTAFLKEAQRARRHTLVLPSYFWTIEPGDIIRWTSEKNGYIDKDFRVDGTVDYSNALEVMVDITEVDPADYDWNVDVDYRPPISSPPIIIRPPGQVIQDWGAIGVILVGDDGSKRPAIKLFYDPAQPDTTDVEYKVRLRGAIEPIATGVTPIVPDGYTHITENIIARTWYEVAGRYKSSSSNRDFAWTDWFEVYTPDVPVVNVPSDIGPNLIDYEHMSDTFQGAVEDLANAIMRARTELREEIDAVSQAQATVAGTAYDQVQLVKVANENVYAAHKEEVQVRIDEDSAIISDLDLIAAEVHDPTTGNTALAAILDLHEIDITNNANGITAVATDLEALEIYVTNIDGDVTALASAVDITEARLDTTQTNLSGTSTGVSNNTITLAVGSSSVNDFYNGLPIMITSGTGINQVRQIIDYNGSTRVATVDANWTTNPPSGSTYKIGYAVTDVAMSTRATANETTVNGHTSTIGTIQTSLNGVLVQYGILGTIDGVSGGILLTGVQKLDGSVSYDLIISVDTMTIANLGNLAKNGRFDLDGGTVTPAANGYEISRWYISAGFAQVSVIDTAAAGLSLSTKYAMNLNLASTFTVYNDYNITGSQVQERGIPVVNGEKFYIAFEGQASTSARIISITPRIVSPSGSITSLTTWNPSIGTSVSTYEAEITATATGRMYLRIERSSTSGNVYFTDFEVYKKNGAKLIVDGTIIANHMAANSITAANGAIADLAVETLKIAGNAVTVPFFYEWSLSHLDGAGIGAAFQESINEVYTISVPNGEDYNIMVIVNAYHVGSGNFEHKVSIDSGHDGVGDIDVATNGGAIQASAVLVGMQEFTSTFDGNANIRIKHKWRGDTTIDLEGATVTAMTVKR